LGATIPLQDLSPVEPSRAQRAIDDIQAQVLAAMTVPSKSGVYVIGPFPKRVNFASQQVRAFNLAWALTEGGGPVATGSKVAVIGAGLAGLTVAAALHRRGVEVDVFEKLNALMPMQRNTLSRYVNPTLNYWPTVDYNPATNFPFLNWSADLCERIINSVETEWQRDFAAQITVHKAEKVLDILPHEGGYALPIEGGNVRKGYSSVVAAVGFGRELPIPGAIGPSYWDDVDTRTIRTSGAADFVISGSGDGGLLEVLRQAYGGFEQGQLTARVTRWADRTNIREAIAVAEAAAAMELDAAARARALAIAYMTMDLDRELEQFLNGKLDEGFKVTLVVRGGSAFTLESAPIHRLMLAHAIRRKRVAVDIGSFDVDASGAAIRTSDKGVVLETYHGRPYVVRHGPPGEIANLLKPEECGAIEPQQVVLSPFQFRPLWPEGYFSRANPTSSQEQEDMLATLRTLSKSLIREYPGLMWVQIARSRQGDGKLVCQFIVDEGSKGFRDDEAPQMLLGKRVEIEPYVAPAMASAAVASYPREMGPRGGRRPLRAGDLIKTSQARPGGGIGSGVIGCFVQQASDATAFAITAGHVLSEAPGTEVYATGPDVVAWELVGTVAARPAGDWDDVAAVRLTDSIAFDVAGEEGAERVTPTLGLLGEQVYRMGRDGRRVEATVTALAANVRFRVRGLEKVLPEAVVLAQAVEPFATSGDSGALVRRADNSVVGVVVATNDQNVFVGPIHGAVKDFGGAIAAIGRSGATLIAEPAPTPAAQPPSVSRRGFVRAARSVSSQPRPGSIFEGLPSSLTGLKPSVIDSAGFARFVALPEIPREEFWGLTMDLDLSSSLEDPRAHLWSDSELDDLLQNTEFAERRLFYIPLLSRLSSLRWRSAIAHFDIEHLRPRASLWEARWSEPALRLAPRDLNGVSKGRPVSLYAATLALDVAMSSAAPTLQPHISSAFFGSHDVSIGEVSSSELSQAYLKAIEPAIFTLEAWRYRETEPELRTRDIAFEISRRLGRAWAPLLDEMLRGHFVTLGAAVIMRAALADLGFDLGGVKVVEPEELKRARAAYSEPAARRALRRGR
jgi:hypothetical protein